MFFIIIVKDCWELFLSSIISSGCREIFMKHFSDVYVVPFIISILVAILVWWLQKLSLCCLPLGLCELMPPHFRFHLQKTGAGYLNYTKLSYKLSLWVGWSIYLTYKMNWSDESQGACVCVVFLMGLVDMLHYKHFPISSMMCYIPFCKLMIW